MVGWGKRNGLCRGFYGLGGGEWIPEVLELWRAIKEEPIRSFRYMICQKLRWEGFD
jgi:hypothetical protein